MNVIGLLCCVEFIYERVVVLHDARTTVTESSVLPLIFSLHVY